MAPRPPPSYLNSRPRPSRDQWDILRPQVEQLYKVQKRSIKDTIEELEKESGFHIPYVVASLLA